MRYNEKKGEICPKGGGFMCEKEQEGRVDVDAEERREAFKRREREAIAEMAGETSPEPEENKKAEK